MDEFFKQFADAYLAHRKALLTSKEANVAAFHSDMCLAVVDFVQKAYPLNYGTFCHYIEQAEA